MKFILFHTGVENVPSTFNTSSEESGDNDMESMQLDSLFVDDDELHEPNNSVEEETQYNGSDSATDAGAHDGIHDHDGDLRVESESHQIQDSTRSPQSSQQRQGGSPQRYCPYARNVTVRQCV